MKELFEVRTKNYKNYYVLSRGFDEAKRKVELALVEEDRGSMFNSDGDLEENFDVDEVTEIKYLGGKFIV